MKNGFEIDLLPVGNGTKSGDCILMRYGDLEKGHTNQRVIIVDGGFENTASAIIEHLDKYYRCKDEHGVYHIDTIVLSHTDIDHVAGLVELVKREDVVVKKTLMHRPWKEMSCSWFKDNRITSNSLKKRMEEAFCKAVEFDNITQHSSQLVCKQGCVLNFDLGARVTILGPSSDFYKTCIANCEKASIPQQASFVQNISATQYGNISQQEEEYICGKIKWYDCESTSSINESSLVFMFEYDGLKILFTGDAGKMALDEAFTYAEKNAISLSDIDILKMPHHGSRKNINPELIDRLTRLKCAYISCVKDDVGHHPSKRLVNMLHEKNVRVYGTSGVTLHFGKNAISRGWKSAQELPIYSEIEK